VSHSDSEREQGAQHHLDRLANGRFSVNLSGPQKKDLEAFLGAL